MTSKDQIKIERVWAMPNRWTFKIKPIAELLRREVSGLVVDPFPGQSEVGTIRNDKQMDGLNWLKMIPSNYVDTVLYDPPYSFTQAKMYGKAYCNMAYWSKVKDELARITKPGGKAICFGWNSGGLSKSRGFEMKEILLVNHGGGRNDTIVTVQVKL
jgi:hypothetical protein